MNRESSRHLLLWTFLYPQLVLIERCDRLFRGAGGRGRVSPLTFQCIEGLLNGLHGLTYLACDLIAALTRRRLARKLVGHVSNALEQRRLIATHLREFLWIRPTHPFL